MKALLTIAILGLVATPAFAFENIPPQQLRHMPTGQLEDLVIHANTECRGNNNDDMCDLREVVFKELERRGLCFSDSPGTEAFSKKVGTVCYEEENDL